MARLDKVLVLVKIFQPSGMVVRGPTFCGNLKLPKKGLIHPFSGAIKFSLPEPTQPAAKFIVLIGLMANYFGQAKLTIYRVLLLLCPKYGSTGLSAPTLTTDGKRVFAIFATGDVIAFDMDGKRVWAKNLGVPDNHYGHSSSLINWSKKLFIQYDTNSGGQIDCLDVVTGNTVWETVRKAKISWASPVLLKWMANIRLF